MSEQLIGIILTSNFLVVLLAVFWLLKPRRQGPKAQEPSETAYPTEPTPLTANEAGPSEEEYLQKKYLDAAQKEYDEIVSQATKRAKFLLLEAQHEGLNFIKKEKEESERAQAEYQRRLEEMLESIRQNLEASTKASESAYAKFFEGLTAKLSTDEERLSELLQKNQTRLNDQTAKAEESYGLFLGELKTRLSEGEGQLQNLYNEVQRRLTAQSDEAAQTYYEFLNKLKTKVEGDAQTLSGLIGEIKTGLEAQASSTQAGYDDFIKGLEEKTAADLSQKQTALESRINDFFGETETMLKAFVGELENRTRTQVDKEIGDAKKIIEDYRRQRLEIVDENIVAILEKTLNLALGKKLTLGDQTELIYEALEEAKKENFFA